MQGGPWRPGLGQGLPGVGGPVPLDGSGQLVPQL